MKNIILAIGLVIGIFISSYSQNQGMSYQYDTLTDGTMKLNVMYNGVSTASYLVAPDAGLDGFISNMNLENISNTPAGNSGFINNISLPGEFGGCIPLDNCYNTIDNKYYFYGGLNVIVVNAENNEKLKEIRVSESFSHNYAMLINEFRTKHIIYNPANNKVYCATVAGELVVIDCLYDTVTQVLDFPFTQYYYNHSTSIALSKENNNVYWYFNEYGFTSAGIVFRSRLRKIDCQANTIAGTITFTDARIGDMITDYSEDTIFASTFGNNIDRIHAINTQTFQNIFQFGHSNLGKMIINTSSNILYADELISDKIIKYSLQNFSFIGEITGFDRVYNFACNSNENILFLTGRNSNGTGLKIINGNTGQEVGYFGGTYTVGLHYDNVTDAIFVGSMALIKIEKIEGEYVQTGYSSNNRGISLVLSGGYDNKIVSVNTFEGMATILNQNLTSSDIVQLGGQITLGCYNPINDKLYYIRSFSNSDSSFISIICESTGAKYADIIVGGNLLKIAWNKHNNKVYICQMAGPIVVLDGQSNEFEEPIALGGSLHNLFINPDNNIIYVSKKVSSGDDFYIIDASNNQTLASFQIGFAINHFVVNPIDEVLYGSEHDQDAKRIAVISLRDNILDRIIDTELTGIRDICFESGTNTLYVSYSVHDKIKAYKNNTFFKSISIVAPAFMTYNHLNEKVYCIGGTQGISTLKNGEIINTINSGYGKDILYNENTNEVYLFVDGVVGNYNGIVTIDCTIDEVIKTTSLQQKLIYERWYIRPDYKTLIVSRNNRIYYGNHAFSNISVIQADHDSLNLQNGWNWLSLPRMKRYGNDDYSSISVLENIQYDDPWELEMHYMYPSLYNIVYDGEDWYGDLQEIKSTFGYKLDLNLGLNDPSSPNILLQGARLHHDTTLTLKPNQENWIGYFIPEAQWPWEAFPKELFNGPLTSVTAQYWAMVKLDGSWIVPAHVRPIKYGDMVIVTISDNDPVSFAWKKPVEAAEAEAAPETEYYSFTEQTHYLPVFIEKGAEDDFIEVAILANGVVRGAAVALENDTLVQVRAYLGGVAPGTPLEFETWSGAKSARAGQGSYAVRSHINGDYELRTIYTGEKSPFHIVSLKPSAEALMPAAVSDVSCAPNPFAGSTTFSFRVNRETPVQIVVYDMHGKALATPVTGNFAEGVYNIGWDGADANGNRPGNGVYIFKLLAGEGQEFNGKVVLIN